MAAVSKPKLLRVPIRVQTRKMMLGTLAQLPNVEHMVAIVEDNEGCWLLVEDGTTSERINWMIDRAKLLLHKVV